MMSGNLTKRIGSVKDSSDKQNPCITEVWFADFSRDITNNEGQTRMKT